MTKVAPGATVQTPLGRGVVLEVRNRSVLVRVRERTVLVDAGDVTAVVEASRPASRARTAKKAQTHERRPTGRVRDGRRSGPVRVTLDVHGLTVEEALDAVDAALNEALLGDASELRVIHGRSSSRIRDALHRHLRDLPAVGNVRLDPANPGVTILVLT